MRRAVDGKQTQIRREGLAVTRDCLGRFIFSETDSRSGDQIFTVLVF